MKSYLKIIPYLICILFASCASDDSHPIQTPRQVNVALTVTLPEPKTYSRLLVPTRTARSGTWTCWCSTRMGSSWSG